MRLTPNEIEHQKFHRSFRGYSESEVDEFLEKLSQDYTAIYRENRELQEKLTVLEAQLKEYHDLKGAVERSVTLAQKTADDLLRQAEKEASLTLEQARQDAEKASSHIHSDLLLKRQELHELDLKKAQFSAEFKLLLETYLKLLEGHGAPAGTSLSLEN